LTHGDPKSAKPVAARAAAVASTPTMFLMLMPTLILVLLLVRVLVVLLGVLLIDILNMLLNALFVDPSSLAQI
jgi:hypothetical protein